MDTLPEFVIPRLTMRDFKYLEEMVRPSPMTDDPMYQAMHAVFDDVFPGFNDRPHVFSKQSPFLYFIQVGETGPVKIGVSGDPCKRLAQLQTAQPERLRLVLAFPADYELEADLHRRLRNINLGGEWFAYHEVIYKLVTAYRRAFYGMYGETCYVRAGA